MLIVISYILVANLLCGCSVIENAKRAVGFGCDLVDAFTTDETEDYTSVSYNDIYKESERISKQAYEAIENKDSKALKALFSTYTAQKNDLDKEIKVFYEKIEGKVISVEEIEGFYSGSYHDAMKGDVFNKYEGKLINLKTDKGYSYCVTIMGTYNYDGFEDKVGINDIYLNYSIEREYESNLAEIGDTVQYGYEHCN